MLIIMASDRGIKIKKSVQKILVTSEKEIEIRKSVQKGDTRGI